MNRKAIWIMIGFPVVGVILYLFGI